jgi:lysophospholipase L1-like esterase
MRTVLFMGDSITDADRALTHDGLGGGYVALVARSLASMPQWVVVNRGISGNRVVDLGERWDVDCLSLSPEVVTIFVGINEVWHRYNSNDPTSVEDFERGYRQLIDSTLASAVPRIVLVTPFLLPVTDEQRVWFDDLDPKVDVVRALAAEYRTALVDLAAVMAEAGRELGNPEIAPDGVHPSPRGHEIIAHEWLTAVGDLRDL